MEVQWENKLACAMECSICKKSLDAKDQRILSVYDNEVICMKCKTKEEQRPDYKATSEAMIRQCLVDIEQMPTGDFGGYCFHHFYPYTCQ
jgi:hypothetical protein